MISRISRLQRFEPRYAVSLGNQVDLRVSDYLTYLRDEPEAKILAVYVEGFKTGDGYMTAKAAREILKTPGRFIVLYKAGRTPEGRLASAGHTASVAGDYGVCRAILEDAGVIVAETVFEFENFVTALHFLGGKTTAGNRVGLISNAGFESVAMSDNLKNGAGLELADFTKATRDRLAAILTPLGVDRLQDVKNPLDTTPMTTDEPFAECARAILADPNVDCGVISPVPMAVTINTLPKGEGHGEDISAPGSLPSRLIEVIKACPKPVVFNIDSGAPYDPMAAMIEAAGIPVFRRSDDAVRFLRKYVGARLRLKTLYGR
jgi:acyl-CoA synthetase (NDP forming)